MRVIAVAALAAALAVVAAPAAAQISPGPLARAHADLDRAVRCLDCHVRGEDMSARCLACHTEIAGSRAARRGLHGRSATGACATCHPDHAGRDFDLVRWEGGRDAFDHRDAGWPLEGAHAKVACADCHKPAFQQAPLVARVKVKDRTRTFMGLETRCATCHEDPHRARFGDDCTRCHDARAWDRIREDTFDHDLTRYPLRGRHAALECAACHDPAKAWGAKPAFARCGDCHADAHAGRARLAGKPADCAACHDVRGFAPSTLPAAAHAKTAYPLEGRHAGVACAKCHLKAAPAVHGTAGVVMRPRHAACADCHADAHGGQIAGAAAACDRCHDLRGFRPSRYGVADHARLELALDGAHAKAACVTCHGVKRAGLPAPAGAARAGTAGFVFALAERACADCHADVHGGTLKTAKQDPRGCAACHDAGRFRPSATDVAMHDRFEFRLEGAHRALPCVACHEDLAAPARGAALRLAAAGRKPLAFTRDDRTCAGCHRDPHDGQFAARRGGAACETCHDQERFAPAVKFDHDRDAAFRLEGAHARIACAACHRPAGPGRAIVYADAPSRCEACHEAGTRGVPPGVPQPKSASRDRAAVPAILWTSHGRGGA